MKKKQYERAADGLSKHPATAHGIGAEIGVSPALRMLRDVIRQGYQVRLEEGNLRLKSPSKPIADHVLASVRAEKRAIVEYLTRQQRALEDIKRIPRPETIEAIVLLDTPWGLVRVAPERRDVAVSSRDINPKRIAEDNVPTVTWQELCRDPEGTLAKTISILTAAAVFEGKVVANPATCGKAPSK